MTQHKSPVTLSANPAAGVLLMCAGVFLLTLSDTSVKALMQSFSPFQVMLVRSLIALPMVVAIVWFTDGRAGFRTGSLWVHLGRAVLVLGALWCFFTALRTMSLAGATAVVLTAPLFVTALSVPLLKERVGPLRWCALLVGFAGAMVIVKPGAGVIQPAALLSVAAAVFYALAMVTARWVAPSDSPRTLMFWMVLLPLVLTSPMVFTDWPPLTRQALLLLFVIACTGTLGMAMITQAFRISSPSIVAPFDYTALIWASLTGWLFFSEVPALSTWLGGGIIVGAGLFVLWRERQVARKDAVEKLRMGHRHHDTA